MTTHTPLRCANSVMSAATGANKIVLLNTGNYPSFSNYLNETWVFTGTDWTDISSTLIDPNGPLPCRTDAVMAFDGTNTMLYGGRGMASLVGVLLDTWLWNGAAWTKAAPTVAPFGRYKAEAANLGSTVVMFGGGIANGQLIDETWIWDGVAQNWSQITSTNSCASWPSARIGHCMAGDGTQVIMFGGRGNNSQYNSTWSFASGAWTKLAPTASPSVRSEACMVYDSVNSLFVLFGGQNEYNYLDETWTYNALTNTWTHIPVANGVGPSGRVGAQMAFDTTSGKTILFGGINATTNYPADDTWAFDGSTLTWALL